MSRYLCRTLVALMLATLAAPAAAQQVLLDKPVRAGELILFPDLNDETKYYYVPDKPRLATDASGQPQFSFLRYVENVRSGADAPEAREGEGGGIVHALVSLGVTPEQLADARRELQRVKAGATIQGPIVFKSGKFGLVSSFKDPNGKLSTQVVGLGSAPLLDGEKAAVSIQLTKLGSKILWESFQTPAPDISFMFEMDVAGFQSPLRAKIEANWDQVYSHQSFNAAVASTYLAAEIKTAFDDLRKSGAIKVTQVGSDAQMDAILTTAYNKLLEAMFEPIGGTGTPSLDSLTSGVGGQGGGLLDRASAMLQRNQADARADNDKRRAEADAARKHNEELNQKRRAAAEAASAATLERDRVAQTKKRTSDLQQQIDRIKVRAEKLRGEAQTARANAQKLASEAGEDPAKKKAADDAAAQADVLEARVKGAESQLAVLDVTIGESETAAADQADTAAKAEKEAAAARAAAPDASADTPVREERDVPGFAVIASFEMKKVRQRGSFVIDLNKYNADQRTLRFDENIGDLRRLMADGQHFRQVNLDDPLFKQREIVAFLDGANAQDFGAYINFVTVRMRKKHGSGTETNDEVRIDRNNFNKEGNAFKLLYGWNGDNDRRRWMDYEYQPVWSFFGGHSVEEPWKPSSAGAIPLAPPYQRRVVALEAAPEAIAAAQVRTITVKVFYKLGATEQVKQATLNAMKNQLSDKIEFYSLPNQMDYDYEITWRLTGNRTVSSGRKTASDTVLLVDELPAS
jgi:hypothetical protein